VTNDELIARAQRLASRGRRTLLGVCGPPGVGKSTLAQGIAHVLGDSVRVVGLDGFHLAQSQLHRLGRVQRKGAIDTFDAAGFVALVRRLAEANGETVYAPDFRREVDDPIAGAVAIESATQLVVVEGNYLLVQDGPWRELRSLLHEVWYCQRDEQVRLAGLVDRHRRFGKSAEAARRFVYGSDQRNAELVATTRHHADLVVSLD
jgi:pantothenate kinase